ncbi:MAG: hypothetical protein ABI675_12860 [Chitinophagaceae bacterium]
MYQIVEQVANDTGITPDDVNYIFSVIAGHLVGKIPALKQVVEDVFANADTEKLKEHLNKLALLLQKEDMDKFKTWQMPRQAERTWQVKADEIL